MKKILITTTAAILLAGCGNKPVTDTSAQTAPSSVDQSAAQAPVPGTDQANTAVQQNGQAPQIRQASRGQQDQYAGSPHDDGDGGLQPVVSVYLDPPLEEPAPVMVGWAPPPMLVDAPPPPPSDDAVWTGGYWVWEGDWVWAHGRWAPPPRHGYHWNNPYYEHRGDGVVFVNGYWGAPETTFVAPSATMNITLAVVALGIIAGQRPDGPAGVFVPPPPGSHRGLIVPAPMGTAPAVVIGAPPIIRGGMHIEINNTHTNNVTNISNVTNITNVTVVAPASATSTGRAVNVSVPAQAHLAAAQRPVVNVAAPEPASAKPIASYVAGRTPISLPPPQSVRPAPAPNVQATHSDQKEHPPAAIAPPLATLPAPAPVHVDHAASQAPPTHPMPQSAAPAAHNENLNHSQSSAAPVMNAEKHGPAPAIEARPAQVEKHNPVPVVQPVNAEKHVAPPATPVAPAPAKRVEPIPQKQPAPAPAPKAAPAKPEPKEGNPHDKDKHEPN